jgi:hypothetical protein
VSSTSAAGALAGTTVTATATCPAGKKIVGGGASYTVSNSTQTNRVALVESFPSAARAWAASVRVNQALSSSVTVTVRTYAVCTV